MASAQLERVRRQRARLVRRLITGARIATPGVEITSQTPDGEHRSKPDDAEVIDLALDLDEVAIVFRHDGQRLGWILCVWEFDQPLDEMICDYTANDWTDALVKSIEAVL